MQSKKQVINLLSQELKSKYPYDFIFSSNSSLFDVYVSRINKDLCFKVLYDESNYLTKITQLKQQLNNSLITKSLLNKEYYIAFLASNKQFLYIKL